MMEFHKVRPENIDMLDWDWLEQIESVKKADHEKMKARLRDGTWTLFRLGKPARGVGVVYPWEGRLFVYYLRGIGLFGTLTKEDLLALSARMGLNGLVAEVTSKGMLRILKSVGFQSIDHQPGRWTLELTDGRQ